jgi:hypothetical protein
MIVVWGNDADPPVMRILAEIERRGIESDLGQLRVETVSRACYWPARTCA